MILHCPLKDHQVSCLICIYTCTAYYKRKCKEYELNFEKIKAFKVEEKYLIKYGVPEYPEPYGLVRKRRAESAQLKRAKLAEKEQKKCQPSNSKSSKPKKSPPKKRTVTSPPKKGT